MGLNKSTDTVFRLMLPAFAVAGTEVLPTPTVREVELGIRNLQHDCEWKSRQSDFALTLLLGSKIR